MKNYHIGGQQLLLITPPSSWKRIKELPDLRRVGTIALDRETEDPLLSEGLGPSWTRGRGSIIGISVAWRPHKNALPQAAYLPVGHPDSDNFDPEKVAQWERDHQKAGVRFVMQNAGYDIGFGASCWNIPVPEKIDDTSAMAYMVDEQMQNYGLDALCEWRGLPGKDETVLREAASAYGVHPKSEMFKLPARYVGGYAEQDAVSTLMLAENLRPLLEAQGLLTSYQLEMDLVPTVHQMMRRGIRIDQRVTEQLYAKFKQQSQQALEDLSEKLGQTVSIDDVRQTKWLAKTHDAMKISYPRTTTGAGSFTKFWMRDHPHWLPRLIQRARGREDTAEKFVKSYIMDYVHEGRLHASVHQYRAEVAGDDEARGGGTRTYRFSYSDPPLQQMPKRDDESAEIRRCFVSDKDETWLSADYSQQEYRLMVHYAVLRRLPKAADVVAQYEKDPNTDFHQMVADMTGLDRKPAKDANFAKIYGAGVKKFAAMIGKTEKEATDIMAKYDTMMPFAGMLYRECMNKAEDRGYIKLLDGARVRFDWWAPWRQFGDKLAFPHCRRNEAMRRVNDPTNHDWFGKKLFRSGVAKALNGLIQGSAARQTKMAMRACAAAGLMPILQVHDELCFSVADVRDAERVSELMRNAAPLAVPMQVDIKLGPSWGRLAGWPLKD